MSISGAMIILSGAGTILKSKASRDAADAEAGSREAKASLLRAQAAETIRRAKINATSARKEGDKLKALQTVAFAANNVALGVGAPVTVLIDTERQIIDGISNIFGEANFRANQLRNEAGALDRSADDLRSAGDLAFVGGLLTGATSIGFASGIFDQNSSKLTDLSTGEAGGGGDGDFADDFGDFETTSDFDPFFEGIV